jgi:phosphonate transport system substrate-binding protein
MKKIIALALMTTAISGAALADGHAITEFRIGILGGENAQDRMNSNECMRAYTQDLLGVETKLFAPADYNGVIQGLLGGTLDMAWLGASSYAAVYLQDPQAVEPVLVKINLDGSYGYHSIGFASVDSGITSLEGVKDKVFGFGDPNSTSGYLIPSIEIPQQTGASMESGDYFGEVKFTGGHEQTIVAVSNGDINA